MHGNQAGEFPAERIPVYKGKSKGETVSAVEKQKLVPEDKKAFVILTVNGLRSLPETGKVPKSVRHGGKLQIGR